MTKLPLLSITTRLILLALAPLLLIEMIFTWYHFKSSKEAITEALTDNGHLIAEQLAEASTFYLLSGNNDAINDLIRSAFKRPYVSFISVHNENGSTIAQHSVANFSNENIKQYLHFEKTIHNKLLKPSDNLENNKTLINKKNIGLIHIYISKTVIEEKTNYALNQALLYSTIIFILSFVFIYLFAKKLTTPFYDLLKHIKKAEHGNLGEKITNIESNEIGILQIGFNNMTQSLLNNRTQLDTEIKNATFKLMNMVSELESKNSELEASKNEALKANKVKSSFLANMSHEIRTPINGIKGFIGLLSKSELNDEQQRYTKIIQQSSTDLITIVNEILDFAKVESGKLTLEIQPFDLIDCIETVRDRLFPAAIDKNIDIFLSIYSDVPRHVIGDQARLKQILINLISNAIKFTDEGYVQIKVYLSDEEYEDSKQNIQFDIVDTGIGISLQDKSKIFHSFQQIESETNRRYSGTGLGLVISRKLAHLMSGNISLESELSKGSTFSLTVPFEESNDIDINHQTDLNEDLFFLLSANITCLSEVQSLFTRANLLTETCIINSETELEYALKSITLSLNNIQYLVIDNRQMNESFINRLIYNFNQNCKIINLDYKNNRLYEHCLFIPSTIHSSNLRKAIVNAQKHSIEKNQPTVIKSNSKRILIVDDNIINLTFAFELLSQWGHMPMQASGALEALELYKNNTFDLVLMDIQMPEYDGIEAMKMLKQENSNKGIPIVALTANALPEEETRLRDIGFDGYISKPIDEEMLSRIINNETSEDIKQIIEPSELNSVNYEETLKLSGNNTELVKQVFQILLTEIPQYQQQFILAKENEDLSLFKSTKHKLEGTTCYASLPKLKSILLSATQMKNFDNKIIEDILTELNVLKTVIRSF